MYSHEMFIGPAVFEIGWDQRNKALVLRILKEIFEDPKFKKDLYSRAAAKEGVYEEGCVRQSDFIKPDVKSAWGFGKVVIPSKSTRTHPAYYEWKIPLPKAKKGNKEAMPDITWTYYICATLSVISNLLSYGNFEPKTRKGLPEKILVFSFVDTGRSSFHGDYYFGPVICRPMFPWLKSFGGKPTMITRSLRAMESAADVIFGEKLRRKMVSAVEANGGLFLCSDRLYQSSLKAHYSNFEGLDEIDLVEERGERITGFDIESHNVDTAVHQLILMVGLAAICDEVRDFIG